MRKPELSPDLARQVVRGLCRNIGTDPDGQDYRTAPDWQASRLEAVLLREQRAAAVDPVQQAVNRLLPELAREIREAVARELKGHSNGKA
jgi:hypothetical protein